ncbi:MAG: hypothetical protein C5B46_09295 [Proteobacteria bacterium]|nr:MAG: hypothetical protein C5B46_09295 [Pseudomonadota bacterium]
MVTRQRSFRLRASFTPLCERSRRTFRLARVSNRAWHRRWRTPYTIDNVVNSLSRAPLVRITLILNPSWCRPVEIVAACIERARALCTLALTLYGLQAAAAAVDPVSVEARRDGEAVLVEARGSVQADLRLAWDVLTAYERYPAFISELKSSRILARSGATAIVEQKGEAGFFLFHFPIEVVFSVTEEAPSAVRSRAISGTFREMTGIYELTEDGDRVRLTYRGRMVPSFRLPPLVGVPALRSAVQKQFTALVEEIGRRATQKGGRDEARQ